MPTISQLPAVTSVLATDEMPISQGGTARATSVGTLLASMQPAIISASPSLLGRTSIGPGGPEQVDVGLGMKFSSGTLVADGSDHSAFPRQSSFAASSDLVVSNSGSPMLMQASLLRGLFSAGHNVVIDLDGVISTAALTTVAVPAAPTSSISGLQVVAALAAQDLVAVSHSGTDCAISYTSFLGGVTIDQALSAGPASDTDTMWVAQGSDVMTRQTFSNVWNWLTNKLSAYKLPVVEITVDTALDTTVHNGHILVCSQPVTLTPLTNNMGSGFHCSVINLSIGDITLGAGFISSSGSLLLAPTGSATLSCIAYSGGTIAFALMPAATVVLTIPGQVIGLTVASITFTTISINWQTPTGGSIPSSYLVQYRATGTTSWTASPPVVGATVYQIIALQPSTNYEFFVQAQNASGSGLGSTILSTTTSNTVQATLPLQITGLSATPTSNTSVQVNWPAETGTGAALSFTVQYRVTGSSFWAFTVDGIIANTLSITSLQSGTSYDFAIFGSNVAGAGPVSLVVAAVTVSAAQSVSAINWNVSPNGTYSQGGGSIGVNAHVSPASSAIKFGFSISATSPPASWTVGVLVNTSLWGAYVPAPAASGTWYAWAEGLDGSAQTVAVASFMVQ